MAHHSVVIVTQSQAGRVADDSLQEWMDAKTIFREGREAIAREFSQGESDRIRIGCCLTKARQLKEVVSVIAASGFDEIVKDATEGNRIRGHARSELEDVPRKKTEAANGHLPGRSYAGTVVRHPVVVAG